MATIAPPTDPDEWDDRAMFEEIDWDDQEPTDAELFAIEAEWPQIEAELFALNVYLTLLAVQDRLTQRRYRRTTRRILAGHSCTGTAGRLVETGVSA